MSDENKWIELSQRLEAENTKLRELLTLCKKPIECAILYTRVPLTEHNWNKLHKDIKAALDEK